MAYILVNDRSNQAITHVCASMHCTLPGATVHKDCRMVSVVASGVAFNLSATGWRGTEDDCDVVWSSQPTFIVSTLLPNETTKPFQESSEPASHTFSQCFPKLRNTVTTDLRFSKYKHKVIWLALGCSLLLILCVLCHRE